MQFHGQRVIRFEKVSKRFGDCTSWTRLDYTCALIYSAGFRLYGLHRDVGQTVMIRRSDSRFQNGCDPGFVHRHIGAQSLWPA